MEFRILKVCLTIAASILMLTFQSCEKQIEIDVPPAEKRLVVDGRIETGIPPIIFLSTTSGYFEPTDLNALEELQVHDADVRITVDQVSYTLFEVCLSDIPEEFRQFIPQIAEALDISLININDADICVYTTLEVIGREETRYALSINYEGDTYTSITNIPPSHALDSLWFELDEPDFGFLYASLTDPAGRGNAYRWFARRINIVDGSTQDGRYYAPYGSAFDDKFIDGVQLIFGYPRPFESDVNDRPGDIPRKYAVGDTVVVKFCTIDPDVYLFVNQFETQSVSTGNPFAVPANVPSNISGNALGVWAGYGFVEDTVVCIP